MSCRGHRQRALIVRGFTNETCRWQRSGHRLQAARSVADASGQRRTEETKLALGLARETGSNRVDAGHGPLDRWRDQTELAQGMIR